MPAFHDLYTPPDRVKGPSDRFHHPLDSYITEQAERISDIHALFRRSIIQVGVLKKSYDKEHKDLERAVESGRTMADKTAIPVRKFAFLRAQAVFAWLDRPPPGPDDAILTVKQPRLVNGEFKVRLLILPFRSNGERIPRECLVEQTLEFSWRDSHSVRWDNRKGRWLPSDLMSRVCKDVPDWNIPRLKCALIYWRALHMLVRRLREAREFGRRVAYNVEPAEEVQAEEDPAEVPGGQVQEMQKGDETLYKLAFSEEWREKVAIARTEALGDTLYELGVADS